MVITQKSAFYKAGKRGLPECYQSLAAWPAVDDLQLTNAVVRRRYTRLRDATQLYLQNQPMNVVEEAAGITGRRFLRLFNRCLKTAPDGKIWGLRAMVKGMRIAPLQRIKPIAFHSDTRAGFQGAFDKLLRDYPDIEKDLLSELSRKRRGTFQPNHLSCRGAQRVFLRICLNHGIDTGSYPFCTKAKGASSLQRCWDKRAYR